MPSLLAAAGERWLVPTYASPRARTWIAAHEWLTFPLRMRGEERRYEGPGDGEPLTVVAVGPPARVAPFCERLVGPLARTSGERRYGVWRPEWLGASVFATGTPAGKTADLAVIQIHRWVAGRFRRAGWRIVPDAVRWHGALSAMPPSPLPKSLRDDLRKVRQHRYEARPAERASDWDEFYATMVVPQAARFGAAAWIPSPAFFRALRKVGVLHFVCRGGARVGGFCAVPAGDRVWYPVLGTLAGDESLRREGVIAAVYALGLEWAKARGYRAVDKGRTSSFLNDGIAVYKRKWGLEPVPDPLSPLFAVKANSPAALAAFARQPVWTETDAGLEAFAGAAP